MCLRLVLPDRLLGQWWLMYEGCRAAREEQAAASREEMVSGWRARGVMVRKGLGSVDQSLWEQRHRVPCE